MVGVDSCVIVTGDGLGESGFRSIGFITGGVVVLTFFGLPCFAPESMNRLNCVSTDTLFAAASSMMSIVVANSSYLSSDSDRIILCFPFPFS